MTDELTSAEYARDENDPLESIFGGPARRHSKRRRDHGPALYREQDPEPEAVKNFMVTNPNHPTLPDLDALENFDESHLGTFSNPASKAVAEEEPRAAEPTPEPATEPVPEVAVVPAPSALDELNGELEFIPLPEPDESFEDDAAEDKDLFDISSAVLDEEILTMIDSGVARQLNVIPLRLEGNRIYVAAEDENDVDLLNRLRPLFAGKSVVLVEANKVHISRRIDDVYSAKREADRIAGAADYSVTAPEPVEKGQDLGRVGQMQSAAQKVLGLIIESAIRDGASDIHIEPTASNLVVRNRVDGKLRVAGTYPRELERSLTTLVKVDSGLRADQRHMPDSGVLQYKPKHAGKAIDIRVETSPTTHGQTVVMRLQNEIWRDLSTLGFSAENEAKFREAIAQPFGVVLVTGPTGSGKTTTLYSSLRERIDATTKIITLENPVEFAIDHGVTQVSMADDRGMTFGRALRSVLRQDPDVVLVGEIRDRETAETAIDAAMTGHLVLSTLHTNDAVGAVPRMTRLGVEPFLLSSALVAVVAQRLVRRLCVHCRVPVQGEIEGREGVFDLFEPNPDGCTECFGGFSGRVPIHEVFMLNNKLRDLVAENPSLEELTDAALESGLSTMRQDGFEKAIEGLTSVKEVVSATRV